MHIYLDVDDTLADFKEHCVARGVPRWEGSFYTQPPETWTDEQRFIQSETNRVMQEPDFWLTMPLAPRANSIIAFARAAGPVSLLTALPAGVPRSLWGKIESDKIRWALRHTSFSLRNIIVCERADKVQYVGKRHEHKTADGFHFGWIEPNVLVDDAEQNCEEWRRAGGVAHHHTDATSTIDFLRILRKDAPWNI